MGKRLVRAVTVYIDTQVMVWLAAGATEKLSAAAAGAIEGSELSISPMVMLELQYLYEIKRIVKAPLAMLGELETQIGLKQSELAFSAVVRAGMFESWTHDPFDRVITAHARADRMSPLVTPDQKIRDNYPRAIW